MKTPSPRGSHSGHRTAKGTSSKKDKHKVQKKNHSFLDNFTASIKKVFGVFKKKNSHPEALSSTSDHRVTKPSFSTGDSSRSPRSSLTCPSSDWYGPSWSESGLLGSGNFTFEEIYKATEHFSDASIVGEGGFGTVYRGRLNNGSLVAIKRFKKNFFDKRILVEFKNEIRTLAKIEHLNLVRLYGYMEHKDERIIVVEYVGNGTLRDHLDGKRGNGLDIAERLDIAIDVAHAVAYLHTYSDPPVIHRDIKSSNILITENLRAKVADFGFARMLTEDPAATHVSTQIKGTAGYLDPEYLRTYQLTEKSDVYSFGVVLIELVTGRHPIETKRPEKERVTIRWAIQVLREGNAVLAMDPRIWRNPAATMAVQKVLKLAWQCLSPTRPSRPTMRKCAEVLWRIRKEYKEMVGNSSSSPSSGPSHYSATFHEGAKKSRQTLFGIKDDENVKFNSA